MPSLQENCERNLQITAMEYEGEDRAVVQRRRQAERERGTIRCICLRWNGYDYPRHDQPSEKGRKASEKELDCSLWLSTWIIRLFCGRKQWTIQCVWLRITSVIPGH